MNMFKTKSFIQLSVISTAFLVSCTHVFETQQKEIDLTVFKNIKTNIESLPINLEKTTKASNNNEEIMKLAVESIGREIFNKNRVLKKSSTRKIAARETKDKIRPIIIAQSITSGFTSIPSAEIGIIEHNGYEGKIENQIDFQNLNWKLPIEEIIREGAKNEEVITDTIQTASAATSKTVAEEDEIKVFEYSEIKNKEEAYNAPEDLQFKAAGFELNQESKVPKYAEAKLSSSVLNVIRRESNSKLKDKNKDRFVIPSGGQSIISGESDHEDEPSVYELADSISKESSSVQKKAASKNDVVKNAFMETRAEGAEKISYKIIAREVDPGVKTAEAYGFEFIPHYDRNDRLSDVSGEINLEYSIMGSQNVVSGMVLKQGYVDIQTDLDLDSSSMKTVVPLIEAEKFAKFLQTNKLSSAGSYLLVNTTKGYSDIELDGVKLPKILLTSKFKIVEKNEEPTFILVAGLSAGNSFVKLKTETGWTQKVLNTQENMITYIDEEYRESMEQSLEIYTETKSGKTVELNTNSIDVKQLSSKNNVRKISTNKVAFKTQSNLNTQKNYLEIKKESTSFIGLTGDEDEIKVPTQREKEIIMTEFGVGDLQSSCLIQVNTSEDIQRFRLGGPSDVGEVYTQTIFADREGNLSTEITEWTNKVYVLGDRTGVLNIQVEYSNGAVRMTNTYCSNDVYLVENL